MTFCLKAMWAATAMLLAAPLSTPVTGTPATTVRVASVTGNSGQEVTVRLEVLGVPEPGLGAFTIDVAYDSGVASPVSCQGDPSKALDTIVCNTDYKRGSVRVGGYHMTDGLVGDTALADITFRLSGDEGACSDLTISIVELTDPTATPLRSPEIENGSLCVGDAASESTPGTPAATSNPGQPAGSVAPNGQQPAGTVAPGETSGAASPGQTPGTSPAATASTAQGSQQGGAAARATSTAAAATGKSGKAQAVESNGSSSSGDGRSAWLIAAGAIVVLAVAGGAGVVAWKRRTARRL